MGSGFNRTERKDVEQDMRMSKMLVATLREVPAEAEIKSHQLMLRAGLMRKNAAGIYSWLPLGLRSLRKVEKIIRSAMDSHGALEVLMPALLPAETYQASGRWDVFGPDMFRLKDRGERDFCLGPTHEEVFTELVKNEVKSYKSLPMTIYQIQTKYRDERRPRFGVMRSREFIMKDAYSFDKDEAGLDKSYKNMYDAYCQAFDAMKLDYIVVDADSGAMGGSGSQEFMVKSEVGEDTIAFCDACGYAANSEKAPCVPTKVDCPQGDLPLEKIHTPNVKTIEELEQYMNCGAELFVKTIIYTADEKPVAVMVRGDREVNEIKLKNYLNCGELALADAAVVQEVTHAAVGFAGPIGISCDLLMDSEVEQMQNFVVGANETDYHYKNVQLTRDFTPTAVLDLRTIVTGDACPQCGKPIATAQGVEVGHIFKLGTKYSKALNAAVLDENGKSNVVVMGCYGIGVSRCLAAVIEQYSDENGIVWPVSIAPYHVVVVPANHKDESQMQLAEQMYEQLLAQGIEAVLDDRAERAGVKFKDAELMGFPVRITAGRNSADGVVEYVERAVGEKLELSSEEAVKKAVGFIKGQLNG